MVRLPRTRRDSLGAFLQVGGSPSDSVRRGSTDRMHMACKRSGVNPRSSAFPLFPQLRADGDQRCCDWLLDGGGRTVTVKLVGHFCRSEACALLVGAVACLASALPRDSGLWP